MLTEVAVSLVGVLILGLGTWSDWLRPVIGIGLGVFLLLGWAVHSLPHPSAAPAWVLAHASMRRVREEWRQFRTGALALVQVRLLVLQALLSILYVSIAGTGLYVVVRGLGIDTVTLWQVLAVYLFSLAAALISPLPLDLGVIEVSGVGAFLAIGVSVSDAVGIMVLNRVLSLGAAIILALVAIVFLPDEFRAAFHERSRSSTISRERAAR
jgi:uncharacterized membrane protein YbhN (UPF0104 family)